MKPFEGSRERLTGEAQHSLVFLCDPLNPASCHLSGRPFVKQVCLFVCLFVQTKVSFPLD